MSQKYFKVIHSSQKCRECSEICSSHICQPFLKYFLAKYRHFITKLTIINTYIFKLQMRNPKKTQIQRMASVQIKKTISVTKCFICNQMFYSQSAFDDHMKVHSSKLSRNLPEDIQRKTMESFKIKKNEKPNYTKDSNKGQKKILNQTATIIRPKLQQQIDQLKQKQIQENQNKQCLEQSQSALRQSTLLIQKIQALTRESQNAVFSQKVSQRSVQKDTQLQTAAQLQQVQLLKKIILKQQITSKEIKITKFTNPYLQSLQQQLRYVDQIQNYLDSASTNKDKVSEIKKSIVKAVQIYVYQNAVIVHHQSADKQNSSFVTDISKGNSKQKQEDYEIEENVQIGYCSACYSQIQYGQQCYKKKTKNSIEQIQKYHIECWQQMQEQQNPK